jgi:ribosome maturation factor RimP
MLRHIVGACALGAVALAAALAAPPASAQERGEEIIGTISSVDGRNIVVTHKDGREIRISVSPSTEVYFQDSGDRKLFPNPGIDDLRQGMGVRFNFNGGNPTKVTVHFVPAGFTRPNRPNPAPEPGQGSGNSGGGNDQIKARIKSIDRGGREITVDVAGRERRYEVESGEASRFEEGDLVVLTVGGRGGRQYVSRIDSADLAGTITRIGGRTVTIEVNGREETYDVERGGILDQYREGDRVRFEVEERRNGRKVITAMASRGRGRR